jgi:hypothetical protein
MARRIKLIGERIFSSSGRFSNRLGKSAELFLAIILAIRHLRSDLLERIEESDRRMRENALVDVETEGIDSRCLASGERLWQVALFKKGRQLNHVLIQYL